MKKVRTRIEKDSLGNKAVPRQAYYGIETVRAVENFPISGLRFHPDFIWALAVIKKACALANRSLKKLDLRRASAIVRACNEMIAGKFRDQFVTDALQSGAGVSIHMNTNEVIANRALEILGQRKGDYSYLHSHDHVNMGQSTNDVIPTALRLAVLKISKEFLSRSMALEKALLEKSREFRKIIKAGRTHLQDAAPITLGQEFSGWSFQLEKGRKRVAMLVEGLCELGIGGSAVGTGLNTTPGYRRKVIQNLKMLTGFPVKSSPNLFAVMQNDADFAAVSGGLRDYSLSLIQIANDLRLLSSGPNTGFGEIRLPALQPGSSIMPGKVNPVIPEVTAQVGYQVIGSDVTIAFAAASGECELNVMRPVIVHNLLQSFEILKNALDILRLRCVLGIKANAEKCRAYAESSLGIAAALNPYIGYARAAECVKEAVKKKQPLYQIVLEKKLLSKKDIKRILFW